MHERRTVAERRHAVEDRRLPGYHWWQWGIIYHVYPLSFYDSNGDGRGDLPGIISRLDYLKRLGVNAVWISPVYRSPMVDFGYDISDYREVDPIFGTMADLDELIAECHRRDMKLILDYVPNHTSDQHPWFRESRSSRSNPKRGWYIWKDRAPKGGPPNNWLSAFGGSAWEWDEATGQYYYHAFLKQQPDLNWRNPEVQKEMLDVMRFWLDRGADGFRVDVMWHIIKDDLFRDNPPNPDYHEGLPSYHRLLPVFSTDQPYVHQVVAMMRNVINEYRDRLLIGEIYLPATEVVDYYGEDQNGAQLPSNFQLIVLPWDAKELFAGISRYDASVPGSGWPNWVLSNHDKSRVASRVGMEQVKTAALLLLTLRGTPIIYYGDEIGMKNLPIRKADIADPAEQKRDPQRSPMQWDRGPNAGFTSGRPWLPVEDDYETYNVEAEQQDPGSVYSLYRSLIALRQSEPALMTGSYHPVGVEGQIIAFIRRDPQSGRRFLIGANLGHNTGSFSVPGEFEVTGRIVLCTNGNRLHKRVEDEFQLDPGEGIIVLVEEEEAR